MANGRNPSMQQIANELGISRTTVSLCLAGKAGKYKINPETSKKIQEYALKIGFVSNKLAQTVAHGRNDEIGVLYSFTRKDDSRVDALFYLVESLTRLGKKFQIHHIDSDTFVKEVINLKGMGISDIIVVCKATLESQEVEELRPYMKNLRVFFNNMFYPGETRIPQNIFMVETDRHKAYYEACKYLHSLGHRTVLVDSNNISFIEPLKIFDQVHRLDFLRVDMKRFFSGFSVGREYGQEVLTLMRSTGATAVLSHNYQYAQGIIQRLLEEGVKVPEDISVLCFGDYESNRYFKVPVTAIEVPVFEMIDAIIAKLGTGDLRSNLEKFNSKLIIRQSTGPAKR